MTLFLPRNSEINPAPTQKSWLEFFWKSVRGLGYPVHDLFEFWKESTYSKSNSPSFKFKNQETAYAMIHNVRFRDFDFSVKCENYCTKLFLECLSGCDNDECYGECHRNDYVCVDSK